MNQTQRKFSANLRSTTVAFCAYDKPGFLSGTSLWIQRLLPQLKAQRIKVRCYIFLQTGEKGPLTQYLEKHGVECVTTQTPCYTEERVSWLLQQVTRDRPNVFVANEVPAGYHAGRWIKAAGIPTVGVIHTDRAQDDVLQSLFIAGPKADAVTAVVCVSEHIELRVRAREHPGLRVRRIPYGAPVPRERVLLSEGGLRIAYVGQLTEEAKQVSLLTRAFCEVVKAVPGVSATLYGDGPAAESVEQILATEGKGLPVKAVGRLDNAALRNALLHTDAVVLLSDFEGLPFSLMEAMGCGCVPVCLRIRNGIPELVIDGVTGLLVSDRGDSFVAAIRRLREDDLMWRRLSDNARLHIEKGYSDEASATAWVNLLSELAEESHPSRIKIPARMSLPPAIPPYEEPESRKPQASPIAELYRAVRMSLSGFRKVEV